MGLEFNTCIEQIGKKKKIPILIQIWMTTLQIYSDSKMLINSVAPAGCYHMSCSPPWRPGWWTGHTRQHSIHKDRIDWQWETDRGRDTQDRVQAWERGEERRGCSWWTVIQILQHWQLKDRKRDSWTADCLMLSCYQAFDNLDYNDYWHSAQSLNNVNSFSVKWQNRLPFSLNPHASSCKNTMAFQY